MGVSHLAKSERRMFVLPKKARWKGEQISVCVRGPYRLGIVRKLFPTPVGTQLTFDMEIKRFEGGPISSYPLSEILPGVEGSRVMSLGIKDEEDERHLRSFIWDTRPAGEPGQLQYWLGKPGSSEGLRIIAAQIEDTTSRNFMLLWGVVVLLISTVISLASSMFVISLK